MAEHVIKLPDVGEGVAEAELVEWHVAVGDLVREDAILAAVMTDKATVEIPSPVEGKVVWLGAGIGDTVAVGAPIIRIAVAGGAGEGGAGTAEDEPTTAADEIERETPTPDPSPQGGGERASVPTADAAGSKPSKQDASGSPSPLWGGVRGGGAASTAVRPAGAPRGEGERPLASPAVRLRAREAGIDLRHVHGSGPAGRIGHEDLDAFLARGPQPAAAAGSARKDGVEEIRIVGLRRRIAEKMALATSRIPHITYVEEIDVTAVEELRAKLNAGKREDRTKLTFLPFLMRAIVRAVGEQPALNATFDDEAGIVRRHAAVHIGMAAQTAAGLMVPVVRHAEARDIWDCAAEAARLAQAARDGTATRDELSGSTITITSLGALGGIATTPLINHPEVAVVGVNKMAMRPMWDGSQFVPRKMMNLSSSFDHRVIDGWDAAVFVQRLKALIETPALIFVEGEMKDISCKLLVIGAGPGGYVCAIRAGQLGVDTVIVEKARPGGTCLNVGCIPSKALIHAADEFHKVSAMAAGHDALGISLASPAIDLARTMAWKDRIVGRLNTGVAGLLKKARVKAVEGHAHFRDGKTVVVETETGEQVIRAETIVIATGSAPVELPGLPFGGDVISSTGALALQRVPASLAVVGGGYIGLELGTAFAKLGAKVTVVESMPRILPLYDAELTRPVARRLESLGVTVMTGAKAKGVAKGGGALLVETDDGTEASVEAEKVLVTVGRKPATAGWGLDEIDLDMDGRFIRIDEQCRTSMRGIHAIGDVTGEPMLAHRAMAQGEMVAEIVAGHRRSWDRRAVPAVCFTDPEIVSVGLSPEEARKAGRDVKIGQFPFSASGRAMTLQAEDGFVRVVARADNHVVLGVQAVGAGVAELAAAFALSLEMGARLEDVAGTMAAHPTLGEAFQESALKALGHALHI